MTRTLVMTRSCAAACRTATGWSKNASAAIARTVLMPQRIARLPIRVPYQVDPDLLVAATTCGTYNSSHEKSNRVGRRHGGRTHNERVGAGYPQEVHGRSRDDRGPGELFYRGGDEGQ